MVPGDHEEVLCRTCIAQQHAEGERRRGVCCSRCGRRATTSEERPHCRPCWTSVHEKGRTKVEFALRDASPLRPAPRPDAPNQGARWTPDMDDELRIRWAAGETLHPLATHFGRTTGSIVARVVKLELAADKDAAQARG
jgi:hypothetical protein